MNRLTASTLLIATSLLTLSDAFALESGVRPTPLMGMPVMTGLVRVRQVDAAPNPQRSAAALKLDSRRPAPRTRNDDVVTTARKTLSGNEEVIAPQP